MWSITITGRLSARRGRRESKLFRQAALGAGLSRSRPPRRVIDQAATRFGGMTFFATAADFVKESYP